MRKWVNGFKTRTFRVGSYSMAATAVVLALAIGINILIASLPANLTQIDTTAGQLYELSGQTELLAEGLENEITLYWIVPAGSEDVNIEHLLERYDSLGSRIKVVKKDPDLYPTFARQYDLESVTANSIIVESGERFRYVDNSEIYLYDYTNYYYDGTYEVSFAGESAITSAIDYVTSEDLPKVYALTGHGELDLSSTFQTALEQENIETAQLSLLSKTKVPADADCIMIYAPASDISTEEKDVLLEYLQRGGKLFLITEPPEAESLTNLEALMAEYGVEAETGIVVEGDSNYYAWDTPYYLLPELESHSITTSLIDDGYYTLLPIAQGLTVSEELRDTLSVTELLTTTDSSFSKIDGYYLETYEKEEGDIDGGFAVAVAITEDVEVIESEEESEETGAFQTGIVWISSGYIADDDCNSQISGGNMDFFLNSINWLCEQEESSLAIHAKSLSYEYLTMDSSTASKLCILMIGVIPVVYLAVGIRVKVRRKRQ